MPLADISKKRTEFGWGPWILAGFIILSFCLVSPRSSVADVFLRVAVLVDRSSIIIPEQGPIRVGLGNEEQLVHRSTPLLIRPGKHGIQINHEGTPLARVSIQSDAQSIKIGGRRYSGSFLIIQNGQRLTAINLIHLEEYLRGVLPMEMSPEWPQEALKAQAVAARTYAVYRRDKNQEEPYDLVSTIMDQVYTGLSRAHPHTDQAVQDTQGIVMMHGGNPILAAYHSTSAGPTEDARVVWGLQVPYLQGVSCPFDRYSPRYQWTRRFSLESIEQLLSQKGIRVGTLSTIIPLDKTHSGRVGRIRMLHSKGELILTGPEFRRILGYRDLPSTRFGITRVENQLVLVGNGSGHGVGMCQWGAKEMGALGYTFDQILAFYYPGIQFAHQDGYTVGY